MTNPIDAILSYARRGWPVLPLHAPTPAGRCSCGNPMCRSIGKHPRTKAGVLDASTDEAQIRTWASTWPNCNWGVATGHALPDGGHLVVVDVDPRNGGDDSWVTLEGQHGEAPETARAKTGGGGWHLLFRSATPIPKATVAPGIDLQATGAYIVVDPSVHGSGRPYIWDAGAHPDETPIAPLPPWLAAPAPGVNERGEVTRVDGADARDTWLGRAFEAAGWLGGAMLDGKRRVRCPWVHEHSDGRGDGRDTSTVLLAPTEQSRFGGWKCQHGHCVSRTWRDVVRALPAPARAVADAAFPPPSAQPAADAAGATAEDVERDAIASEEATADDPLRGLVHLGPLAVRGHTRLVELAAEPVQWVWQDIAVAGTIVLIAGGPSEGKTTLLFLLLAARMNVGEPIRLLERVVQPAPAGRFIVLIEGEHSDASAARKLIRSIDLLGVDERSLDRVIIVARKAVRLGSPQWADVEKMVAAGLVSDIAIDTVARVAPAEANDEREQVAVFDSIVRAIDMAPTPEARPTAWVIAHTRKGAQGGDLSDVSGSAQRAGQADSVLLVKGEKVNGRTVASCVTCAKLREEPEEYPQPVTFSIARDPLGDLRIFVSSDSGEDDERPIEQRILEQLQTGPKTKSSLAEKLKRSREAIDEALSTLFKEKSVQSTMVKVGNRSVKGFELRPASARWAGNGHAQA